MNSVCHTAADPSAALGSQTVTGDDTITRIMRLSERPDVISFAGGFPSPDAQQWQSLSHLTHQALLKGRYNAFNYSPTSGMSVLREQLASRMTFLGRETSPDEILVTAGGIAGLDLVATTYLRPGDAVAVGLPCYVGALEVFRNHGVRLVQVATDEQGINLESLQQALRHAADGGKPAKFIYIVPTFDNPTGVTCTLAHRQRLLALAAQYDAWLLEDGAYQELYFGQCPPPMLTTLAPERVIHVNTFSKTLCPGFRLGWMVAPAALIAKLSHRKQTWDQCASSVGQQVAMAALATGFLDDQLAHARDVYRRRRNLMLESMDQELAGLATWNVPEGGFFVWLHLPQGVSAAAVTETALADSNVALLPGSSFYSEQPAVETIRLCYSSVDEARIAEGIKGLRRAICRHVDLKQPLQVS